MPFKIKHKPEITAAAIKAQRRGEAIDSCPGELLPWFPIWKDAFRQSEIDQQHKEAA
jgi:hypothetical protein